jgi:hypothetical protein
MVINVPLDRKFYLLTEHRGGVAEEMCADLVNAEAARVVYKNNYSFGVKLFNIYMVRETPRTPYGKF